MSFFSIFSSTPEHIKLSGKISSKFIKDINKNTDLVCGGGGGAFYETVNQISMIFYSKKRIYSRKEAFQMGIELVEELVKRYNNDTKIRPHLKSYPFTHENVDMTIFFNDEPNNENLNIISLVHLVENKVFYNIVSSEGKRLERVIISYAEAYEDVYGHECQK